MISRRAGTTIQMDRLLLLSVTAGEWPVELVEGPGLWDTKDMQTFVFLPPILGPSGTLLIHRLAYTYPTSWTTESLSRQLGLTARRLEEALGRAADFNLIFVGSVGIEVPTRLGPLPRDLLRRIPRKLQSLHDRLADEQRAPPGRQRPAGAGGS
jgi:hypothetical protein